MLIHLSQVSQVMNHNYGVITGNWSWIAQPLFLGVSLDNVNEPVAACQTVTVILTVPGQVDVIVAFWEVKQRLVWILQQPQTKGLPILTDELQRAVFTLHTEQTLNTVQFINLLTALSSATILRTEDGWR